MGTIARPRLDELRLWRRTLRKQPKHERREEERHATLEAQRTAERRRRYRQILSAIAAVVLVAVLRIVVEGTGGGDGKPAPVASVHVSGPARDMSLAPGKKVPSFSAPALVGSGTVDWNTYKGRKVVLSIWASWCPHCQAELPVISSVVAEHPDVSLGQEPGPSPEEYMEEHNLMFPVAVDDAKSTLARAFGVSLLPTVYFVNSDGKVSSEWPNEQMPVLSEADLQQMIGALE
jgi:thiol-disulfide isomerase/thioredoxin